MKTRKCRRKRCLVILLFNAFFILVIFISSYHHTNRLRRIKELRINKTIMLMQQAALHSDSSHSHALHDKKQGESIVLFWTDYFGGDPREDATWILVNKTYPNCFTNCRVVLDRNYFGISDAVIFHSRDMRKADMPLIHPVGQIWIYLQQESPSYTKEDLTEYNNVFNWTMTYRQDSDIYHPYFLTIPRNMSTSSALTDDMHKIMHEKTKLVAWIVSNCHTKAKRENYVAQLADYVPVDIYGNCGEFSCDRSGEGCFPQISHKYKFYLSFENSLCQEYITEKFSNALKYNLVPVVYGSGNYHKVAPPNSYINANDFASPKALAEYLLLLDGNPKLYSQYFQWKTKYKVIVGDGFCSLCAKLQEHKKKPVEKTYKNLFNWWNNLYQGEPENNKKIGMPACRDPPESLGDSWNLLGVVDLLKYMRRWFYKQVLGY